MKKYTINFWQDNIYEIYDTEKEKQVFKGKLSECEAWIRLKENKNVNF